MDIAITDATLLTLRGDGEFLRADVEGLSERARARARDVFGAASDDWRAAGSALVEDADAGRL